MEGEILSKRNKLKTAHEGHLYVYDKKSKDSNTEFWRCYLKNNPAFKCKARLHKNLITGELRAVGEHSDNPNAAAIEVQRKKTALKRRAAETVEQPQQIINKVRTQSSLAAQGSMGTNKCLARIVQRTRNRLGIPSTHFTRLADIDIPESFRMYESTPGEVENFLLADSGSDDPHRILIFGRESARSWVGRVRKIYVDGTFSLAPQLIAQIFVILAERPGVVTPLCYVLMPNKEERSYNKMLDMLTLGWPDFNPGAISMDFEQGLRNAFAAYFPEAELHGCFFHLVQNMKKKVAACGLSQRYRNEPDFALNAKMISAMAFLPPEQLEDGLRELRSHLPLELQPVLEYFEDFYMGRLQIDINGNPSRRAAMFPVFTWTVYERTLQGDSRTNNYVEAAHRSLQRQFAVHHPGLLKFIEGIKCVQQSKDADLERYVAGNASQRKRNRYLEIDRRIMNIITHLESRTLLETLRGVAHNYEMNP